MSRKNDSYKGLLELSLSPAELERAKSRVRSRRTFLKSIGLDDEQATLAAVQIEVDRFVREPDQLNIPSVPEGSGLDIRGSRNPKAGVSNPLHYSFTYYDASEAKKMRIPYDRIPAKILAMFPDGVDETIEFKRKIEEEQGGIQARIERINTWIEQNKEHRNLQAAFIEAANMERQQKNRRYTKGSEPSALRLITEFFLNPVENHFLPDVRHWQVYFDDFLVFLKNKRNSRNFAKGETLTKNTQKNYISCLNRYIAYVWNAGKLPGKPHICPNFPRKDLPRRGVESIITPEEEDAFEAHFGAKNLPLVGAFMRVANHIAARPSEVLGITMTDIFSGDVVDDPNSTTMAAMKASLSLIAQKNGLKVHGFVRIRGQVGDDSRQEDGSLVYHPSKTVPKVDPKFFRYCPIADEKVWNKIVDLVNIAAENDAFGDDPSEALLFEGVDLTSLQEHFREFRKGTKWEALEHTPYCCRHTGCTWWTAKSKGDLEAAQKILGHATIDETKVYSHLLELQAEELEKSRKRELGKKAHAAAYKKV